MLLFAFMQTLDESVSKRRRCERVDKQKRGEYKVVNVVIGEIASPVKITEAETERRFAEKYP